MTINYTSQFKRDYKKIKKQNKDLAKLRTVIEILAAGNELDPKYKDHPLFGEWKGYRDCHIESDWLLIYKRTSDTLTLERTGSHSDLFK
ncbi:MAG: type II toxin-antitoxin system YafQ family toxin [candidate division KSB1 bacterium]|nr:type II toxin-antitoxin system YafQ family toxin [candidate division KSB1 bacterium]MDZ7400012.1 type II toxin-antitoxin system YafQ family toxin [candidate division KSB1 bacterium]